jgi:hypothetical protein
LAPSNDSHAAVRRQDGRESADHREWAVEVGVELLADAGKVSGDKIRPG